MSDVNGNKTGAPPIGDVETCVASGMPTVRAGRVGDRRGNP